MIGLFWKLVCNKTQLNLVLSNSFLFNLFIHWPINRSKIVPISIMKYLLNFRSKVKAPKNLVNVNKRSLTTRIYRLLAQKVCVIVVRLSFEWLIKIHWEWFQMDKMANLILNSGHTMSTLILCKYWAMNDQHFKLTYIMMTHAGLWSFLKKFDH